MPLSVVWPLAAALEGVGHAGNIRETLLNEDTGLNLARGSLSVGATDMPNVHFLSGSTDEAGMVLTHTHGCFP